MTTVSANASRVAGQPTAVFCLAERAEHDADTGWPPIERATPAPSTPFPATPGNAAAEIKPLTGDAAGAVMGQVE